MGGKTVAGEDLIVQIVPIPITTLDLMQRVRFDIGMALAALLSLRSGDMQTSMEEFSKACFFGVRCLEILQLKTFALGYDQIYDMSRKVVTESEYREVITGAHEFRTAGKTQSIDILYKNISLLDSFIEPTLVAAFNEHGNVDLL